MSFIKLQTTEAVKPRHMAERNMLKGVKRVGVAFR
jgi:hypothetical protein